MDEGLPQHPKLLIQFELPVQSSALLNGLFWAGIATGKALSHSDEMWMEEALREAQRAEALGEVPVGAVVVYAGRIVGRGSNRNITDDDPTAHAEIVALREASRLLKNYRLVDCDLYVTIEPCAMCAGAITNARIRRLVYGSDDIKAGAVRSAMQVLNHPSLNHTVEVTSGVLAARCMDLMQAFFRGRRIKPE